MTTRSEKGERYWNGRLTPSKRKGPVSHTGIGRKLQDVRRDLALLEEQGKVKGFSKNVENADTLSGLVEDIRDTMIDYQVCILDAPLLSYLIFLLDIVATRYIPQELSTHRESQSITSRPCRLTGG